MTEADQGDFCKTAGCGKHRPAIVSLVVKAMDRSLHRARESGGPTLLRFTFREHVRSSEDCRSDVQQINSSGWE
jgi:hypothetical protein